MEILFRVTIYDRLGWFGAQNLPPLAFEHDQAIITSFLAEPAGHSMS